MVNVPSSPETAKNGWLTTDYISPHPWMHAASTGNNLSSTRKSYTSFPPAEAAIRSTPRSSRLRVHIVVHRIELFESPVLPFHYSQHMRP